VGRREKSAGLGTGRPSQFCLGPRNSSFFGFLHAAFVQAQPATGFSNIETCSLTRPRQAQCSRLPFRVSVPGQVTHQLLT
jgi:hypothetical protein